ncbi:MAG: hypothetical protein JWN78_812 [Bacteroidota bacterium]|nr:hypothetical protein [Bacteroidota bacterium]
MIYLNFIPFTQQDFQITIFRKLANPELQEEGYHQDFIEQETRKKYLIAFDTAEGYDEYTLPAFQHQNLAAKALFVELSKSLPPTDILIKRKDDFRTKRIYFKLQQHPKGSKTVWIEPYFLRSKGVWGILLDYSFVVNDDGNAKKFKLDRDILIASGTLNEKGYSNVDYYLFKHQYLQAFVTRFIPAINTVLSYGLSGQLIQVDANVLSSKTYVFGNGSTNNSSYIGISKNPPLSAAPLGCKFYFLYKKIDRDIAVSLLKGLRGESNPATFAGMEKLFKLPFTNDCITGAAIDEFDDSTIDSEIAKVKANGANVLPIIITNSKKDESDERLYYRLKHKFTNAGLPCQVVTKDLINNDYSLKYSLSNIGLQIFAKLGGKPWKMKPATSEYLIVGIGQSYNLETFEDGTKVEKNITYSVLTDSSGLFKDIEVLGEGIEGDSYYEQLISSISGIINKSGYKKVSLHVSFRLSKDKILNKIVSRIPADIELNVLVINSKNDFFGYDYNNNGLVPFESTYIKIAKDEFLVWFEGLQYNNPKITKRFGNPLLIKFWFSNKPELFREETYKESLLQDCINLSGANWRGFKAKQLPVSVFYCQRIAEFISKFKEYDLAHIEISNLKPWFL